MEILLPRMMCTDEIVGTHGGNLLPEGHAPGAKSLVCIGLKASYKNYHNTGPQHNGHKNQGFHTQGGQKINDDTVHGGQITHIYIKYLTVFFE